MSTSPDTAAAPTRPRRSWLRFSLRSLLILVTLSALAVGGKLQYDWYQKKRLVAQWVAPLAREAHAPSDSAPGAWGRWRQPPLPSPPPKVQPEDQVSLLSLGVLELNTSEERFAALAILMGSRGTNELAPTLRVLLGKSRHPDIQAALLHLISLDRNLADIPRIEAFLDNSAAELRAAAAESLGYIHEPSYPFAHGFQLGGRRIHLNTAPPIDASALVNRPELLVPVRRPFEDDQEAGRGAPPRIRDRLETLMLRGATPLEREAAARALVAWPPDKYTLRLAEWGVWIDSGQQLQVAESVLAEIPPFVHGAGNSLASLPRNRYDGPIVITKPIIHLTADRPLAVDLEVAIASGRPWFVYPRPDGFTVHLDEPFSGLPAVADSELEALRPKELRPLEIQTEGYPWIHPLDRSEGESLAVYGGTSRGIMAIGLRWQSLIVVPERQPWMKPPDVPASPPYAWWTALRDVPSGWIASQGEAERFLYYDGPTLARSPHIVGWSESRLTVTARDMFRPLPVVVPPESNPRDCLYIDATGQQPRATAFQVWEGPQRSLDLTQCNWRSGNDAEQSLRELLLHRGLTDAEAEGLLASWRVRFFQTPGRRLLTILTPADYGRVCPLKIRPPAQQIVRVGIILTDLLHPY